MTQQFGGQWTEDKLEILRRYLDAYTTALKNQPFQLIYVDAFAGEGYWRPPLPDGHEIMAELGYTLDDFVELRDGSPRIALDTSEKPFDRLLLIEKDPTHYESLMRLKAEFPNRNIEILNADANDALPMFCDSMGNFDRAVVFLDPYATQVSWETVDKLAQTEKVDCWILFPLGAIARMLPTGNEPPQSLADQLDRVFGGREYWQGLYSSYTQPTLFGGDVTMQERTSGSDQIANRYRERLESVFVRVAPVARVFRNSRNAPMFSFFFAASNMHGAPIAMNIANSIMRNMPTLRRLD